MIYDRWKGVSGGSVWPSNPYVVNRGNHKQLSTAFKHLSYICKVRSKDFGTGEDHKRYFNSRLKPKKIADQHPAFNVDHNDKTVGINEYQSQLPDRTPSPEKISVQLLTPDDGASTGNYALPKRSGDITNKAEKIATQISIAIYQHEPLEQFFTPTISPITVLSTQPPQVQKGTHQL